MIVANALCYNTHQLSNFLGHHEIEEPLAIQLGGSDPDRLGEAAYLVQQYRPPFSAGFQEINLNAGCPSNKAKRQGYGAELMLEPDHIGQILHEMKRKATASEISLKCRIGVNPGPQSFEDLCYLMRQVEASGVRKVILHARMCQLYGLSPAQNRSVPPLHPELVHRLVTIFPTMRFILNGGIQSIDEALNHLHVEGQMGVDGDILPSHMSAAPTSDPEEPPVYGVMIGRAAYQRPWEFSYVDTRVFGARSDPLHTRGEMLWRYLEYADRAMEEDQDEPCVDASEEYRCVHESVTCGTAVELDSQHQSASINQLTQPVTKVYGKRSCTLIKPLHHFFQGCPQNTIYKQKLDLQVVKYSKQVDRGNMRFSEMILPVVNECIDPSFLQHRGI
jgi:tRNA-dihydrouridine synthase A